MPVHWSGWARGVFVCVFVEMDRRLYALQPLWSVRIRRWLNVRFAVRFHRIVVGSADDDHSGELDFAEFRKVVRVIIQATYTPRHH